LLITSTPAFATPRAFGHGGFVLPGALVLLVALGTLVPHASASASAAAAAKPRHELTVTSEEVGGEGTDEFRIVGTVPTFKGRKLKVQLKVNGGAWTLWKTSVTDGQDGSFEEPIYGGRRGSTVCYKVVVPSTKRYRTTKAKAGCITTG
jgi:hypothetical protein